ncbi:MAG TPA: AMP-binding protein [Elusimicrobiota bacterium]|nr:AMP-binding protein [Elusimicrobiota bacterium]
MRLRNPLPARAPARFNFAGDVIDRWAKDSRRPALRWIGRDLSSERLFTFAGLSAASRRGASALSEAGLKKGDRVLLLLPRVPAWWEAMLALSRAGLVAVPATTQLTPKDIRYRLEAAQIAGVIADPESAAKVDEARAGSPLAARFVAEGSRPGWSSWEAALAAGDESFRGPATGAKDPALLFFTSGTTGHPKMVLHTQVSYPLAHRVTAMWLGLTPRDLHWNLSDNGWAKAAWSSLYAPWNAGACILVHDARGKFDPQTTLDVLERFRPTSFCAPPTAYRLLVQERLAARRLPRLRSCVSAGEPLNPEVIAAWKKGTGVAIREGYGQTESVLQAGTFPGMKVKPGSMGLPSPGFPLAVIDERGRQAKDGAEGDLAVRVKPKPPMGLFAGYWKNPAENRLRFKGRWYLTGDRATRDADGYLWFVGRSDDVIKSSGYRIGPFEVESALIEHPAVLEAAVVGVPDEARGQIVKAFCVLADGHAASPALARELQEHVKRVTAPYKYPREIEFVESLPKTISGKIRRVELRRSGPRGS